MLDQLETICPHTLALYFRDQDLSAIINAKTDTMQARADMAPLYSFICFRMSNIIGGRTCACARKISRKGTKNN